MQYNPVLAEKAEIVIANKMDLLDAETGAKCIQVLEEKLSKPVCPVSMVTGSNLDRLIGLIVNTLHGLPSSLHEPVCG
ncbi:MAG: Obg GTP-binding protein [Candidatus Brocadia fulgida]|uniref:Obg GTP-binding protein n=1 Tax=Candidatus Brocadia fulgida TaxID=380242 RepID=A0A0M2UU24_9BACT|nr:MAG: Obg GTP-binding protein [Candidatus Brocadia fulgida]